MEEEIRNYRHVDFIKNYKHEILKKAEIYINTFTVKSMSRAFDGMDYSSAKHYKIAQGSTISIKHIISIIMFTDYSKLSASLSSSFRKNHSWELIDSIKKRNQQYAWWSKYLLEAVQVYGDSGKRFQYWETKIVYDRGTLKCPLFCGMSMIMNVPQFQIKLLSPTSTSTELIVAMKFGGDSGIIIQFNNEGERSQKLRAFDVSLISRFREEDERYLYIFTYFK